MLDRGDLLLCSLYRNRVRLRNKKRGGRIINAIFSLHEAEMWLLLVQLVPKSGKK